MCIFRSIVRLSRNEEENMVQLFTLPLQAHEEAQQTQLLGTVMKFHCSHPAPHQQISAHIDL